MLRRIRGVETLRILMMMISAGLLRMAQTGIKAGSFDHCGILMPDILVLVRHRIERIEHRHAVFPDADWPERRAGLRTRVLCRMPRNLENVVLV